MLDAILKQNFILSCDSYKVQHKEEYPQDTLFMYSVIVPRKPSKYAKEIVAMGQTYLAAYLATVRITIEMIDEAEEEIIAMGYSFDRNGWETIVNELDGRLPLSFYAVEEGRVVKPNTPIAAMMNTDFRFPWLVSYVETIAQSMMWKMSTVASMCRAMRITIEYYMKATGSNMALLEYMLHNFGDRGAACPDEAIRSAIAHAALFSGSDCTSANRYIKKLYGTKTNYMSSVEATEHSVMCSWSDATTKDDFGAAVMACDRLDAVVARTKAGIGIPVMSVVIDTYDDERFVSQYMGVTLKDRILNSGGKMVFRPDTGNPLTKPIDIITRLGLAFGAEKNEAGYYTLDPRVGVIQGDGIGSDSLPKICRNVVDAGFSMDNILFGMGGGLTHAGGRDDFSFCMKATARFNGTDWINMLKEPKSDLNKTSLSGLVRCIEGENGIETIVMPEPDDTFITGPGWKLWFVDGKQTNFQSFDDVRLFARA